MDGLGATQAIDDASLLEVESHPDESLYLPDIDSQESEFAGNAGDAAFQADANMPYAGDNADLAIESTVHSAVTMSPNSSPEELQSQSANPSPRYQCDAPPDPSPEDFTAHNRVESPVIVDTEAQKGSDRQGLNDVDEEDAAPQFNGDEGSPSLDGVAEHDGQQNTLQEPAGDWADEQSAPEQIRRGSADGVRSESPPDSPLRDQPDDPLPSDGRAPDDDDPSRGEEGDRLAEDAVEEAEGETAEGDQPEGDQAEAQPDEEESGNGEGEAGEPVEESVEKTKSLFDDDEDEALAAPASEQKGGSALFDDDEEEAPKVPKPVRPSKRRVAEPVEEPEEEGDIFAGGEVADYVVRPMPPPPPAPDMEEEELWQMGLPMSVGITEEVFDEEVWADNESNIKAEKNANKIRSLKQVMNAQRNIFVRQKADGTLESNARLVEFSDGSCALFIGNAVYEADARDKSQAVLVEASQAPIYRLHGTVSYRRIFKPPSVSAMEAKNIAVKTAPGPQKRTKLQTVQQGAESEQRLKRQIEEQEAREAQASLERRHKRNRSALDANFLEAE